MDKKDCEYISEGTRTDYREKIIGLVEEIENLWILKQILQFIANMTKED